MANKNPSPATRFKAGNKANPSGVSSDTHALRQQFLSDLQKAWKVRGAVVLEELSPAELVRAVTAIMPKEAKVEHAGSVAHQHSAVSEAGRLIAEALAGGASDRGGDVQGVVH
jgi:hypothetical protein